MGCERSTMETPPDCALPALQEWNKKPIKTIYYREFSSEVTRRPDRLSYFFLASWQFKIP
jgi:hypothetical protein